MHACIQYEDMTRYFAIDMDTCCEEDGRFVERIEQHLFACETCHALFITLSRQLHFNKLVMRDETLSFSQDTEDMLAKVRKWAGDSLCSLAPEIAETLRQWLDGEIAPLHGVGQVLPISLLGLSSGFSLPGMEMQEIGMDDEHDHLAFSLQGTETVRFRVSAAPQSMAPLLFLFQSNRNTHYGCYLMDAMAESDSRKKCYMKEIAALPSGDYQAWFLSVPER